MESYNCKLIYVILFPDLSGTVTVYPRVVNGKVITRPTYDSYQDPYLANYHAKKFNPEPPATPPMVAISVSVYYCNYIRYASSVIKIFRVFINESSFLYLIQVLFSFFSSFCVVLNGFQREYFLTILHALLNLIYINYSLCDLKCVQFES